MWEIFYWRNNYMKGILLFIKNPQLGKVKTRLALDIGEENALLLYKNFVVDIIHILKKTNYPILIFFTPSDSEKEIEEWLGKSFNYYPQKGSDLGEKMFNAFNDATKIGFEELIIIGSDCLDFKKDFFHSSFEWLNKNDYIIGPSEDGGYYLLGMKKDNIKKQIFEDVIWSTEKVFEKTIKNMVNLSAKYKKLPIKNDIDDIDDLTSFYKNYKLNNNLKTINWLQKNPDLFYMRK